MFQHLVGSFIIRIAAGVIFFAQGLVQFQGGIENTENLVASIGLPGFSAYVIAGVELIGGILLILGFGTRMIAAVFAAITAAAIFKVKMAGSFVGGYELDAALLAMSLHLLISDQSFSAMKKLKGRSEAEKKSASLL